MAYNSNNYNTYCILSRSSSCASLLLFPLSFSPGGPTDSDRCFFRGEWLELDSDALCDRREAFDGGAEVALVLGAASLTGSSFSVPAIWHCGSSLVLTVSGDGFDSTAVSSLVAPHSTFPTGGSPESVCCKLELDIILETDVEKYD